MVAHAGLVRWVVRRQWLGELSWQEALQAGRIGLWHALAHFDGGRGTRFSTYAVPAIERAVWAAVAAQRRQAEVGRVLAGRAVARAAVAPEAWVEQVELATLVQRLVGGLPPRLRQVVVGRFGLDGTAPQTLAALGQRLGVTRQRVQQLEVEALAWLAQPAHSLALRRWLGRAERADYRRTLAGQRQRARQARALWRVRRAVA